MQFDTQPPVPPTTDAPGGLFFAVEVWVDTDTGYQLRAALDGSDWVVEVFDYAANTSTPVESEPVVADGVLYIVFPQDVMPEYRRPFRWSAATEWGDADRYNDACPGGSDPAVAPEDRLTFP